MEQARPVLLEPIMKLEVVVPEAYMGDVMGDMDKRRGRILGMEPNQYGEQVLSVEVPQAEILKYALDLRAMFELRGRGQFKFEFVRYFEEVPEVIAKKVIESRKQQ